MKYIRAGISVFFEYDTPKIVHINSKKVGIVNRIIQFAVIAYIIGWAIIWKRGYQDFDDGISSVTSKVKGVAFTNFSQFPELSDRIWDVADYVVPPQENNAFFITTNVIITKNQSQTTCDEDPNIPDARCTSNDDCPAMEVVTNGNGVKTGNCIDSTQEPGQKVCEIYAWCPVEVDRLPWKDKPMIDPTNFTVLIKNNVEFPKFKVKRRNIVIKNKTYLQSCQYDPVDDPYCPIFRIGKIAELADENIVEMGVKGGVLGIIIDWNCDFDYDPEDCLPSYEFRRIDDKNASLAKGWNFRYANYFGTDTRTLIKAYGVRFIVLIKASAGKFNGVPLLLNLGSGLGLLAVATVLCDCFVLYCLKRREFYRDQKYLFVKGDDAYQALTKSTEEDAVNNEFSEDLPR